MKILFSSSEGKITNGDQKVLDFESFKYKDEYRKNVIEQYNQYVNNADDDSLIGFFATKNKKTIDQHKIDIFKYPTLPAIERYCGVGYKYLDYLTLNKKAKDYIDSNLIIFPNLFGPLCSRDLIPNYKFKQGQKLNGVALEKEYKKHFSKLLDNSIKDNIILDLRASFYEKFYTVNQTFYTMKFIKNNKVVSHWAKAYRGLVLRDFALRDIKTMEDFIENPTKGLVYKEQKTTKLKTEFIFNLVDD